MTKPLADVRDRRIGCVKRRWNRRATPQGKQRAGSKRIAKKITPTNITIICRLKSKDSEAGVNTDYAEEHGGETHVLKAGDAQ